MMSNNHNNPEVSDNVQEDLKLIKGDMIGDTVYSERWVLKTLMSICQNYAVYCEDDVRELETSLEEDLCTLWDMSAESDVASFLMNHDILDLITTIIGQCQNARLMEIMIGVLGNLACQTDIQCKIEENKDLVNSLVALLRYTDTRTLVQLVRLIRTCIWQMRSVTPGCTNIWITTLLQDEVRDSLAYIFGSSVEADLLISSLKLMETLIYIKIPNTEDLLGKYYGTSEMVAACNEGLRELMCEGGEEMKEDTTENQLRLCISSKEIEDACQLWVSIIYAFSFAEDGQQALRGNGGQIITFLEYILRYFMDLDQWKEYEDYQISFFLNAASVLNLLLPVEFNRGCFVCLVSLLERVQGRQIQSLQEILEECIVSVSAAEGVQSQMFSALDECHAPEVELCFMVLAKRDRALLAQLLAEVNCTEKHQRLCDIANKVLSANSNGYAE